MLSSARRCGENGGRPGERHQRLRVAVTAALLLRRKADGRAHDHHLHQLWLRVSGQLRPPGHHPANRQMLQVCYPLSHVVFLHPPRPTHLLFPSPLPPRSLPHPTPHCLSRFIRELWRTLENFREFYCRYDGVAWQAHCSWCLVRLSSWWEIQSQNTDLASVRDSEARISWF